MKKFYFGLLLFILGAEWQQAAFAGHILGADLKYASVAPNVYVIDLKVYRDCAAITTPTTLVVNLKADGCHAGRNVTVTKVGTPRIGNPYCTQQPVACNGSSLATFEENRYTTTIIFSAAEAQCSDWVLSFSDCGGRGQSGNIQNPQSACLYVDAFLKLNSTINNNSPEFAMLDVLNLAYNEKVTYSSYALDADGDSLVYSMPAALTNATTPVTYKAGFSGASPIASSPAITIDPHTGSISLKPTLAPIPGENQYAVVVKVDEYRKINGVTTKVGSIKRDMIIAVVNSQSGPNSNANPYTTNYKLNGQIIAAGAVINAPVGASLIFEAEAFDPNTGDVLTMTSDAPVVLPGASFTTSGTPLKGTVAWVPTAGDLKNQLYYFHVNIKDNFCNTRGIHTSTFALRVTNPQNPTGVKDGLNNDANFIAYPNPFTSEVAFKIGKAVNVKEVLIFNVLGQDIDQLVPVADVSGETVLVWKNAAKFPAGTYVARLVSAGRSIQTLKFTKLQ